MIILTLSYAIVQRIKKLISQSEEIKNVNQLAMKAGLNESAVRAILLEKSKNPKMQTMYYISFAFGLTLSEFYDDELFNFENIDDD